LVSLHLTMCATSYTVGPQVYQVTRREPEDGWKGTRASPCRVERREREGADAPPAARDGAAGEGAAGGSVAIAAGPTET